MTDPTEIARVAAGLTRAQREALDTLPTPGWKASPVFVGLSRNVSYSNTWRKSAKYRRDLEAMEEQSIVQRRESRGETLWRLTKPFGIAVRDHILREKSGG